MGGLINVIISVLAAIVFFGHREVFFLDHFTPRL